MSTQTDQVDDVETNRLSSDEETDYAPREAFMGESAQPEPLRLHVSTIICNLACEINHVNASNHQFFMFALS